MATTQNAGDLQLASTSPRMDAVTGTTIDFANVTGTTKPANNATKNIISSGTLANRPIGTDGDIYTAIDTIPITEYKKIAGQWLPTTTSNTSPFAILTGTVNSANYASYLSDGSVTARAFAQNVGSAAELQTASITVTPDTRNVIINVGGVVIGAPSSSGGTLGTLHISENGVYFVDSRVVANFPNSNIPFQTQMCVNHALFRSSAVPSGNTTYEVRLTASPNPVGTTGHLVRWTYIQVLVLKR